MKKKCLPCTVHYGKSIKEILFPILTEFKKQLAVVDKEDYAGSDDDIDEIYEEFHEALDKNNIDYFDAEMDTEAVEDILPEKGIYEFYYDKAENVYYMMKRK